MGRISSRAKGVRGEIQVKNLMNQYTLPSGEPVVAKRGCQHAGGVDTPDVQHNIPGLHLEVKLTNAKSMTPAKAREALMQAKRDAESNLPVVVWRSNRTEWVAMLTFSDLLGLLGCHGGNPDQEEGNSNNGK